jgi:hypothetical protein
MSDHVVYGAIDEAQCALLHHPSNPVVPHVDVLGMCVVLVVVRECNYSLVV